MDKPLYIDFETYSPADLKKVGLWNYSHHPQTGVSILGFAFSDEPVESMILLPGRTQPGQFERIAQHINAGGTVVAHNAAFEMALFQMLNRRHPNIPALQPEQVICTMAECYAMSLPGALENAAAALGLRVTKDTEGRTLMLRMCKPMNMARLKDGTDTEPKWCHDAEQFTFLGNKITGEQAVQRLAEYCRQDVEVERAIHKRVVKLSAYERKVWCMDYRINQRGVLFDPEAVYAALDSREQTTKKLDEEMNRVTEGAVAACSNVGALKDWAADYGVIQDSLAKGELEYLTGDGLGGQPRFDLPEPVREALDLRREAGRATSVAKLATIAAQADDAGRLHNLFQYHGAGTGRFAGRAVQPHNFTRDLPKPAVVEEIMAAIKARDTDWIDLAYGPPLTVISQLLRGFIVAEPGKKLIGGDYSNVEGRGIAWLAGEEWKLDAFREADANPDGPDIYERAYAGTFDKDPARVTSDERQIGKVLELAFGYQGGKGACHTMGAAYGVEMTDEEADDAKTKWRAAHPKIKQYWYDLQNAALNAVRKPGRITTAGAPGRQVKFRKAGSFLWMLLPSGRTLCYPYPQIRQNEYGDHLTYKTVPSADDYQRGRIVPDPSNTRQWARVATYGGKLAENATQAICRDLLVDAMLRLEEAGYPVVLHVHDESVTEGDFTEADRQKVESIMNTAPVWAKDFPLVSECWLNPRYMKT